MKYSFIKKYTQNLLIQTKVNLTDGEYISFSSSDKNSDTFTNIEKHPLRTSIDSKHLLWTCSANKSYYITTSLKSFFTANTYQVSKSVIPKSQTKNTVWLGASDYEYVKSLNHLTLYESFSFFLNLMPKSINPRHLYFLGLILKKIEPK